MRLSLKRLNLLIWVLIYGGLIVGGLGIALHRAGEPYGAPIVVCCAVAVVIGLALLVFRSRLPDA